MQFTLTFQFPRDNSIPNLESKITHINAFLKNHMSEIENHRHFGVQLLHPSDPSKCERNSVRKFLRRHPESVGNYILGFFFFNSLKEEVGNLTLLYDLGKTPSDMNDLSMDVWAVSALCAMSMNEVDLKIEESSIDVSFICDDADTIYSFLSTHLSQIASAKKLRKEKELTEEQSEEVEEAEKFPETGES